MREQQEATKNKNYGVYITLDLVSGKPDVVGVKLVKIFEFLQKKLQPFGVLKSDWEWSGKKAAVWFILGRNSLPETELKTGPPLKLKDNVVDFKKKYKNTFIEKGRIMAKVKTNHPGLKPQAHRVLKDKYVQEKIKKSEVVIA